VIRRGLVVLASLVTASTAFAGRDDVLVQRTRVLEPAAAADLDVELAALGKRVDALVYEAVQDLGLNLDITVRTQSAGLVTDEQLLAAATDTWVVASRLERGQGQLTLKLLAVPPGSQVLYVRSQAVDPSDLDMRVVLMMRDLLRAARGKGQATASAKEPAPRAKLAEPARSPGKAVLALSGALLGGFVGYSLQQASGSEDERLVYPLAALGAGIGLGSSMLVAEEWSIGTGDAWFLSAGMSWPVLSGIFIARGFKAEDSQSYGYGLLGATAGVTLATAALSMKHVSEGGAALTHSGAAFGTLLGGLIDLSTDGRTDRRPDLGIGFGAGGGVLLAGALATQVQFSASRVLMIDLGASLGALTGAAAASPLLLVEDSPSTGTNRNRIWLASVAAGTLAGGLVSYFATRNDTQAAAKQAPQLSWKPSVSVIAVNERGPVLGAGIRGVW